MSLGISIKNRITNSGFTYDNAGNLTADGVYSYSWNAENRLTSTNGVNYTYDGDGQRVKKDSGKRYWYGLGGEVLVETDLNDNLLWEFVYFGGAKIARRDADGTIHYFFADHLGTNRVMTSATGVTQQESTYYPFGGEQREITSTVGNRWKFTGLERDGESGLDHTLFRKYASNLARWLSPDPFAGDILNPQSLNRYNYVLNNPTNLMDPLGLDPPVRAPRYEVYNPWGWGSGGGGATWWIWGGDAWYMGVGAYGPSACYLNGLEVPCEIAYSALSW